MLRLSNLAPCLLVIAFLAAGLNPTTPALAHDAEQEIHALNAKWVEAFKQKDIAAIEAIMAPDALLLAPDTPAVQGSKAVAETWRSWSELANVEIDFGAVRIEVSSSGDMAYDYGTYTFAFDSEEGRVTDKGKYIVVWKKIDGAWRAAADIFNGNGPQNGNESQ